MTSLVVAGGLVARPDGTLQSADIRIENGTIAAVGDLGADRGPARVIDAAGCLVLPGFVNMHSHSYGTLCRHDGSGLPLEPWMNYASAGTVNRTAAEIAVATQLHAIEALRTGTTTLVDHIGGAVPALTPLLAAYEEIGIRARVAPMIADIALPDSVGLPRGDWPPGVRADTPGTEPGSGARLIEETLALRKSWTSPSGRVDVMLGPSAPQRCGTEMLAAIADAAEREDMLVHTHLLETRLQSTLSPPGTSRSWVDALDRAGLLSSRLSTAHNVWLDDADLQLLSERQVTLVHNPHSNLQLGSGVADLGSWRSHRVRAALGTDSVNCGGSMDMIDAMRLAALLHRAGQPDAATWETPQTALALATAGSAALRIGRGTLEPGEPADVAVFELTDACYATGQDPLATLVLGSWSHAARTVVVAGRVVLEDYALRTVDESSVIATARQHRNALMARNAGLREIADRQRPLLTSLAASAPYPRPVRGTRSR